MSNTLPSRQTTNVTGEISTATPVQTFVWHDIKRQEATQFFEICWVDQAHVIMLVQAGILSAEEGKNLLSALVDVAKEGSDALPKDPTKENFLSYIEAALENKTGKDLAAKLHTARSRIDQSATINLMVLRDAFLQVIGKLIALQTAMLKRAEEYPNAAMSYYTHMQQSQPGTFGHYLLAKFETLDDDLDRCKDAFKRLNRNPLGGVGRSGTSWPTNRKITADLLGFDGIVYNSLRCRDTDYAAEMSAVLSHLMSHINDVAADFELWCMREINYITLPNSFCAVSSIFPQKKNPLTLDIIRLQCGPAITWGSTTLATYRCLGTGDQIVHGVPPQLGGALTTTTKILDHMAELMTELTFNEKEAAQVLAEGWTTLSNLTDWLAQQKGIPFRIGYNIVKNLKADCDAQNIPCSGITADMVMRKVRELAGHDINITQQDVDTALDPTEFIRTRTSTGSLGPDEVQHMIRRCHAATIENAKWLDEKNDQICKAQKMLCVEVRQITHPDMFA